MFIYCKHKSLVTKLHITYTRLLTSLNINHAEMQPIDLTGLCVLPYVLILVACSFFEKYDEVQSLAPKVNWTNNLSNFIEIRLVVSEMEHVDGLSRWLYYTFILFIFRK
jgi:hypothetical protein